MFLSISYGDKGYNTPLQENLVLRVFLAAGLGRGGEGGGGGGEVDGVLRHF